MYKQIKKKYGKKILAGFFASLMIFQSVSGTMEIAAYELGKISLTQENQNIEEQNYNNEDDQNVDNSVVEEGVLRKEPKIYQDVCEYEADQEVVAKRTQNSKTYLLADGSYVSETYFEPIHKWNGNSFVEIDNTLQNIGLSRAFPVYENRDGLYSFKVEGSSISMENADKQQLNIENNSANLNVYSVKENVILYSEAYANIDMEYRVGGNSVSTNFYINGNSDVSDISFVIHKGNLSVKEVSEALQFIDADGEVVFTYTKPTLYDAKNISNEVSFSYEETKDSVLVNLQLNTEWINDVERVYPLTMASKAKDQNVEINVDTAYNRSASPNTASNYYDLYVGYEDGSTTGGTKLGIARTYVHISNLNLGTDKEIISADLKLWKRAQYSQQWNTISIGKTTGYVRPMDATWNNKPSVTPISTTTIRTDPGWQSFDIKSYVEDIYNGKNNTIELKATNESTAYTPNVFSSESGTGLPKVSVKYKDAFDINPDLPVDVFDSEMRVFSILNKGFEALSFDGIAKPNAQVTFELVERGTDEVIRSETSKGVANKYFIDPIYITNYMADTQKYGKDDVNYTSDYITKAMIPKYDTPYEYKVKVKNSTSVSTKDFRSDSFIKYQVKVGDNLKNIASYYGVPIEDIKKDNHLTTSIVKEDDVLLIRFKKDNDKVSKDIYTPPVKEVEYKAKYVDRGPRCSSGICPIIDPVNSTTGNYFYEGIDFTIKDADEFNFTRYYNSTGPQLSNMFGNGFTTPIESYISYDKDSNILYFSGDGRIVEFKKTSSGYAAKEADDVDIQYMDNKATIVDTTTEMVYRFDEYGYLDTMTSKEGVITKINYDAYGLIESISVGEKQVVIAYNESKLVKSITLPSADVITYTYDDKRNLLSYTDASGNSQEYEYNDTDALTKITDKNGQVVTQNTYDEEGRVVRQIDGNNNESTLIYEKNKTTLINADGREDVYTFNEQYDTLSIMQDGKIITAYTYDELRNITSIKNEEGVETNYLYEEDNLVKATYSDGTYEEYEYDSNHHLTYQRDRDGKITNYTYNGNDILSITDDKNVGNVYQYDEDGRVIQETDPFNVSKSYTYNGNMVASITHSNGLIEAFEYDANGNVNKETDNQGKILTYLYNKNNEMIQKNYTDATTEQWTYDNNGNIEDYKDRLGGIKTHTYDENNNLMGTRKGKVSTKQVYNEMNQVISETDEKGLTTTYTYDIQGNKISEIDAYENTTTYEYDADNNVIKITDCFNLSEISEYEGDHLVKSISKEGLVTTYEYDEYNREIKKTNPNGTIETKEYEGMLLRSEVDAKGSKTNHYYDAFDREIKTEVIYLDGFKSVSETVYDAYGDVIETKVDGAITKHTYDVYHQVTSTTDAMGNTTSLVYDIEGNVIQEIDGLGNTSVTTYDANNNVVSQVDKNTHATRKKYDSNNILISETDALGYVKTYTYDDKGQIIEVVDGYKNRTKYVYDDYGNKIQTLMNDVVIEEKEYDRYGREVFVESGNEITKTRYDDYHRVIESTNILGLTLYTTYDEYGNVVEEKDSEGLSTQYVYDKYNRKIKTIDAYERVEETEYNVRDNAVKTISYDGLTSTSTYNVQGSVLESVDGLGKTTINTYNTANQLLQTQVGELVNEYVYNANGSVIETIDVNNSTSTKTIFDANGNTIETIDALGNSTKSVYDANNQIIQSIDALGNKKETTYDAYGNIIKETDALSQTKQYQFNEWGLLEKEIDERNFETQYEYNDQLLLEKVTDSSGNVATLEYNEQQQKVKEMNPNQGVTTYTYDVYGRESKVIQPNGKEINYTYDALGNVLSEVSNGKETKYDYDEMGRLQNKIVQDIVQESYTYNELNQQIQDRKSVV